MSYYAVANIAMWTLLILVIYSICGGAAMDEEDKNEP